MLVKTMSLIVMLVLSISLMFSSCVNEGGVSLREVKKEAKSFDMRAMADEVMEAVKSKDVEKLKSMMNPGMLEDIENLDYEIERLINFPKGHISGYKYQPSGDEQSKDEGQYRIREKINMKFTTGEGSYMITVHYEVVNTYSPENKGICFIAISGGDTDEILRIRPKSDRFYVE
jgi:hypothetical protein